MQVICLLVFVKKFRFPSAPNRSWFILFEAPYKRNQIISGKIHRAPQLFWIDKSPNFPSPSFYKVSSGNHISTIFYHFYWKKAKLACNLTKQYLVYLAGEKQWQSLSPSPMQPAFTALKVCCLVKLHSLLKSNKTLLSMAKCFHIIGGRYKNIYLNEKISLYIKG